MIDTLQDLDTELDLINISRQDIMNSIKLSDVKEFLEALGVNQIILDESKGCIICPTICHNPINEASSMKLYWYQETKNFHCYTECGENMSIFDLYQKFMALNSYPVSKEEAEDGVKKILKHIHILTPQKVEAIELEREKYLYNTNIPILDEYSKNILSYFTHYYHPTWLHDGITKKSMDKFNIGFSIIKNNIVIPHFDINGRLIGIRVRAIDEDEVNNFGKYHPIHIGDINYRHQLQFNLYGLYEHKQGISKRKVAIIAEGEKSVLLDDGFYGDLSNTVACCGSSFNKYQVSLLTNVLGANEIVVAMDKEYDDWRSERGKKYKQHLEQECKRYKNQAIFSYIWDYDNVLKEKDSPFDRGKDTFEYLYKNRVFIR